jgi:hypothetical protein
MSNFDILYSNFVERNGGSPDLKPLLRELYEAIVYRPKNLSRLKDAMAAVLLYLTSPAGRTHENCKSVDQFFCIPDDWERSWSDLPQSYQDVLEDMGGILHDTLKVPDIAVNFESTPEQLLARTRALPD